MCNIDALQEVWNKLVCLRYGGDVITEEFSFQCLTGRWLRLLHSNAVAVLMGSIWAMRSRASHFVAKPLLGAS